MLIDQFGPVDYESERLPFTYTDYYTPEMGPGLFRRFIGHRYLVDPHEGLIAAKLKALELENRFAVNGSRRINIDPGYLSLSKLVLSSTKDFYHRIYIGKGLFAEVTLNYTRKEGFTGYPWTFPDYKTSDYRNIMLEMRNIYKLQLKEESGYDDE
jgi:hypothetical protein